MIAIFFGAFGATGKGALCSTTTVCESAVLFDTRLSIDKTGFVTESSIPNPTVASSGAPWVTRCFCRSTRRARARRTRSSSTSAAVAAAALIPPTRCPVSGLVGPRCSKDCSTISCSSISSSGSMTRLRPAPMYASCSAVSSELAIKAAELAALSPELKAADAADWASLFSISFSSLSIRVASVSVALAATGSALIVPIISLIDLGTGRRSTLYFSYNRLVKAERKILVCSRADCSRFLASDNEVSVGWINDPYLLISGARSLCTTSSTTVVGSISCISIDDINFGEGGGIEVALTVFFSWVGVVDWYCWVPEGNRVTQSPSELVLIVSSNVSSFDNGGCTLGTEFNGALAVIGAQDCVWCEPFPFPWVCDDGHPCAFWEWPKCWRGPMALCSEFSVKDEVFPWGGIALTLNDLPSVTERPEAGTELCDTLAFISSCGSAFSPWDNPIAASTLIFGLGDVFGLEWIAVEEFWSLPPCVTSSPSCLTRGTCVVSTTVWLGTVFFISDFITNSGSATIV